MEGKQSCLLPGTRGARIPQGPTAAGEAARSRRCLLPLPDHVILAGSIVSSPPLPRESHLRPAPSTCSGEVGLPLTPLKRGKERMERCSQMTGKPPGRLLGCKVTGLLRRSVPSPPNDCSPRAARGIFSPAFISAAAAGLDPASLRRNPRAGVLFAFSNSWGLRFLFLHSSPTD